MGLEAVIAATLERDEPGSVPAWSGRFVYLGPNSDGTDVGVMFIHQADIINHRAPEGWHFMVVEPAIMPVLDVEVWYLARVDA